jgi:hypothetical protein
VKIVSCNECFHRSTSISFCHSQSDSTPVGFSSCSCHSFIISKFISFNFPICWCKTPIQLTFLFRCCWAFHANLFPADDLRQKALILSSNGKCRHVRYNKMILQRILNLWIVKNICFSSSSTHMSFSKSDSDVLVSAFFLPFNWCSVRKINIYDLNFRTKFIDYFWLLAH